MILIEGCVSVWIIVSFSCVISFSKFIHLTSLASRVWNAAMQQIFQCDITMRDMMIHLLQNIRILKRFQNALYCVLHPQCVVLSIINLKTSRANWCTAMNIYIMTKKNLNLLLIGSLQRQLLNVNRFVCFRSNL